MKLRNFLLAASLLTASVSPVFGATLNWDGSNTANAAADGGSGTWDTNTTANWWTTGPSDVKWTDTTGTDTAVFGNTAGTVTLSGSLFANALNFTVDGYTLTGGTLTLAGTSPTITVGTGTAAIGSIVAGTSGLTKAGTGTLTLSGANTYTGTTIVNNGTLKWDLLARNGNIAAGNYWVNAQGVLELSNTDTAVDDARLANATFGGTGTLNKTGGGYLDLTFSGSTIDGFNGTINAQAGTLGFNNGTQGSGVATLNVAAGATVDVRTGTLKIDALTGAVSGGTVTMSFGASALSVGNNNGSGTFAGAITGGLALVKNGAGTQTLSGANTYTGATIVNGGVLDVTGSLGNTAVTVNSGGTYALNGTGTGVITVNAGGMLTGTGSSTNTITFNNGSGILLNASGSVQGATVTFAATTNVFTADAPTGSTVSREVIRYTGADPGTATLSAASNYRGGSYSDTANKISLTYTATNETWNPTAGGTWDVGTSTPWTGNADGKFYWGDAVTIGGTTTQTITLAGNLAPSSVTVNNTAGTVTLGGSGSIVGPGILTKSGAGTLALTGANTYSGATTVNGGTLVLSGNSALGGLVTVNNGGTFSMSGPANLTGGVTVNGGGTFTWDATTKAVDQQPGGMPDLGTIAIASGGVFNLSNTKAVSFGANDVLLTNQVILGAGTVNQTGGGVIDLFTGTNLGGFSGTYNVVNGILSVQGNTTAAMTTNATLNLTAGTGFLDLRTQNFGVDQLTGGGTVGSSYTTAQTLTVGTNNGSSTFNGVIRNGGIAGGSGVVSLTKTGTGTFTLTGANTYTGGTNVNAGALKLDWSARSGTLSPANTFAVASAGTLELFNTVASIDNTVVQNTTISGAGTINKTGAGYWDFHTGSTFAAFTGTINVLSGTLAVNNVGAGATASGATLDIASGAAFDVRYNAVMAVDRLKGSGTLTHSYTDSLTVAIGGGNGSSTFSGVINNTGGTFGIAKNGTGTLTLTGANTYNGTTTVNGGVLSLDFSATGAPTTNIINNSANSSALSLGGGTLLLTGKASTTNSQRFNGLTVAAGSNTVDLEANAVVNPLSLSLGAITHSTGGSVTFLLPTGTQSVTNGVTTSSTNDSTGILGAWAFVGAGANTRYATVAGGNIVVYTGGTPAADHTALTDATGTVNYDLASATGAVPATVSANTIRYTGAAGTTAPGTSFTVNGLMNAGTGLWTIGTGQLTVGANKELVVNTANADMAISGVIADNAGGASALTKAGAGTLTLTGANTYTGATTIGAGTLEIGGSGGLGGGTYAGAITISTIPRRVASSAEWVPPAHAAW